MIEVEVVYKGLTRRKVPFADRDSLPKTDVLFVIIWKDGEDVWSFQGRDFYGIKLDGANVILDEWDEEDKTHVTKPLATIEQQFYTRVERATWIPSDMDIFTGIQVTPQEWADAQAFYRKVLDGAV